MMMSDVAWQPVCMIAIETAWSAKDGSSDQRSATCQSRYAVSKHGIASGLGIWLRAAADHASRFRDLASGRSSLVMPVPGVSDGRPDGVWDLVHEPYASSREQVEERMARAIGFVRGSMRVLTGMPLVPLPFVRWHRPARLPLALAARLLAVGGTFWSIRRLRQLGTTADVALIVGDTSCSLGLMALLSRSVEPRQRNSGMVSSLSFALVSSGLAGLGSGGNPVGATVPAALALGWLAATWPDLSMKLASDTLGFFLWYSACALIGQGFREMAALSDAAQAEIARSREDAAEQRRLADLAREHERAYREIHDYLLPVVDAIALGQGSDAELRALAQGAARHARAMLIDRRQLVPGTLAAALAEIRDDYSAAGIDLSAVLRIDGEPPPPIVEALAAAVREALSNVRKHAVNVTGVTLFAEATAEQVEIVVRDHGVGFDPDTVYPGGGLGRTFRMLERFGGRVDVMARHGQGTRVRIFWTAEHPGTQQNMLLQPRSHSEENERGG